MSLLFSIAFIAALMGKMPTEYFTADICIVWALFSIGDALWFKNILK